MTVRIWFIIFFPLNDPLRIERKSYRFGHVDSRVQLMQFVHWRAWGVRYGERQTAIPKRHFSMLSRKWRP